MSDIVCSYKIRDTDRTGQFIVHSDSNLQQLRQFVSREFFDGARPICIVAKGKGPIRTDEALQEILAAGEVELTLVRRSHGEKKPMPTICKLPCQIRNAPENIKNVEQASTDFSLGSNMRTIFSQLGLSTEEQEPEKLMQQLEQLPAPLPNLVRQAVRQGNETQPKALHRVCNHLARQFGKSKKELVPEMRDLLAFVSQSQNKPSTDESEKPATVNEAPRPKCRAGAKKPLNVMHQAICDECKKRISGIRYKCLQCADFDYCQSCENDEQVRCQHSRDHVFAKLNRPRDYHTVQRLKVHEEPLGQRHPQRPIREAPPRLTQPRSVCKMPRVEALEQSVKQLEVQLSQLMSQ